MFDLVMENVTSTALGPGAVPALPAIMHMGLQPRVRGYKRPLVIARLAPSLPARFLIVLRGRHFRVVECWCDPGRRIPYTGPRWQGNGLRELGPVAEASFRLPRDIVSVL